MRTGPGRVERQQHPSPNPVRDAETLRLALVQLRSGRFTAAESTLSKALEPQKKTGG